MESRGNSTGERDSGTDSNKANFNLLDGADADSKGIQNLSLYSHACQGPSKYLDDYTAASSQDDMKEDSVHDLSNALNDALLSKQLKPVLEIGNGLTQPCYSPYGNDLKCTADDPKRSPSRTCLTMSLGLYDPKSTEIDCGDISLMNLPRTFGSTFEPHTEGDRESMKLQGMNPIKAKPRQFISKQVPIHQQGCSEPVKASHIQPLSKLDTSKESVPVPIRVARPPVEGRGRNQLLPRYWPRITDQELQQITAGNSNSKITPLFEKMLSASDAGRIGRLVLPKACAEAYFPPISQPEGLPLKIQDVSGKDWVFQFRYWPNNNSRMYVLEGVTPCIQSMQLQAGDTVTFSRLDPEGKLVMGYRRAPSSLSSQDTQQSVVAGSSTSGPSNLIGTTHNIDGFSSIASVTGLLSQPPKVSEVQVNGVHGHLSLSDTGYGWYKSDKGLYKAKESSFFQSTLATDKKKLRPPPSKSKRAFADMDEAAEFRITWQEAQDLLRSPPNVAPSIITIEGFEFEEYEEPPVLGKRTIFTAKECGSGEDQWAQCDDCGSWRKVPSEVFLPTRWVCNDNVWDAERNFCNAPQEVDNEEIECLIQHMKEVLKHETTEPFKGNDPSLSGLEALANVATTGENNTTASSSPAATTKHPRHRPGCTCIVCIQPPSGKGPKHKPTCNCNVCTTVKRRFKTLMMRRKKRQSEREAEHAARKKQPWIKEDAGDANGNTKWQSDGFSLSDNVSRPGNMVIGFPNALPRTPSFPCINTGNRFFPNLSLSAPYMSRKNFLDDPKAPFDLNTQPDRDEEANRNAFRVSMVRLLQNASHPLERYLKEQGLVSLVAPQHMTHPALGFGRINAEREAELHSGFLQPSTILNTERSQDEPCITLAMPRYDTITD
ncbi:hypothetical protein KP509_29G016600 [Ceratopteris richardii]|uniref:Uncharacterized protein n=2 Tax=Ceratopteris richardii TaxID=49495 RepID=A0A8T2R517_CERRI|nr:hypothetical protein KP509_29G016600 [Ceratopteris richardii]KAH7291426.1 hypothetical protein KP509_29G016600 [Ceratopteris richardii]KAH7291427.1 hypothetical protein KP509_29G016600 [Ceratopteris richardii]